MIKLILFVSLLITFSNCRRSLPEYKLDLDLPVKVRYQKLLIDMKIPAMEAMDKVFNQKLKLLKPALRLIAKLRGPETAEMQEELQYFADSIGISVEDIQIVNWLAELGSIMIPDHIRKAMSFTDALDLIGFPMCTGIIAYDTDGTVNHARNQDFALPEYLSKILYTGIFIRNGVELFRAQMYAGFAGIITGYKKGVLAVEVNTRYPQAIGGNANTMENLILRKQPLGMWVLRKIMEEQNNYDDALYALRNQQLTGPIYFIVSGVRSGIIIARDPDSVAHEVILGIDHPQYIVMTNFDYWNNDWREYFDPTANFYRRRVGVQRALDGKTQITQDLLYQTINRKDVIAKDTLYQVIMNVETGYFNSSTPYDL